LREYRFVPPELHRVPTRDGFMINALLTKPADYDATRRYPVWVQVYAGPDSQTVRNAWNSRQGVTNQALANEGMVVWQVDPRSASGAAPIASWQCYQRLGQTELLDIEDSLRWLIDRGVADPQRIGITGHSYGGYMTSYAMTRSTMFACGIAGAPVTDWRNYDTIYTERYMRTPANNPEGYEQGCVWNAAKDMHGRLLLAHGMMDDNVHFQNAVQLINELQKHKKMFDLMIFPQDRHGFARGAEHYRELMWDFIRERLLH
jgi:dipeptidyl-peptidase-4